MPLFSVFFLIFLFNKNLKNNKIHFADSHVDITVMIDHIN